MKPINPALPIALLWGYASCCAYYQGLLVKPSSETNISDGFIYSLWRHVSAYLMSNLKRIVKNIKHNRSVVEIATSFNILYDSPEDAHQIGRNMSR
jgi:hypothetical protein